MQFRTHLWHDEPVLRSEDLEEIVEQMIKKAKDGKGGA